MRIFTLLAKIPSFLTLHPFFPGTDLDDQSELKHGYLQDAIMCLNLGDPIVIHNKERIISELQSDLNQYVASHPSQEKMTKDMRMLLMATSSLGKN